MNAAKTACRTVRAAVCSGFAVSKISRMAGFFMAGVRV